MKKLLFIAAPVLFLFSCSTVEETVEIPAMGTQLTAEEAMQWEPQAMVWEEIQAPESEVDTRAALAPMPFFYFGMPGRLLPIQFRQNYPAWSYHPGYGNDLPAGLRWSSGQDPRYVELTRTVSLKALPSGGYAIGGVVMYSLYDVRNGAYVKTDEKIIYDDRGVAAGSADAWGITAFRFPDVPGLFLSHYLNDGFDFFNSMMI